MAQVFSQPSINHTNLVDVIIPAYNASAYIRETLASVAIQGSVLAKIIIVNDGSTDNTLEVATQFAKEHLALQVQIIDQVNAGLSAARNAGIRASTAPFIALLDADDVWLANKLSKQLQVFDQSSDDRLGLVYCAYGLINQYSKRLPSSIGIIQPRLRGDVARKLLTGNFISGSGSAVLIKKVVITEIGLFDESLRAGEDWDMWLRIAQQFHFDYCPEELVLIRLHENNMQKDSLRMLTAELMILNKFYKSDRNNLFLLWKIRTILFNRKLSAANISGFNQCHPKLQSQLSGIRLKLAFAMIYPLALLAKGYLAIKE
jgi:glycosyltransferase involved in cell wall biosynthesis